MADIRSECVPNPGVWSRELPAVPGWYFVRGDTWDGAAMAEVFRNWRGELCVHFGRVGGSARIFGAWALHDPPQQVRCEWAGPLEVPL